MTVHWDVGTITRKRAEMHPDKTAVIFEDQAVTYRELNDRANRCAHFFQENGIRKGDSVAVILLNCVEFLEAYLAAAKLGAIFVPLQLATRIAGDGVSAERLRRRDGPVSRFLPGKCGFDAKKTQGRGRPVHLPEERQPHDAGRSPARLPGLGRGIRRAGERPVRRRACSRESRGVP